MGDAHERDRRRKERKAADVRLECRIPARPATARLVDVSETGCRIELGTNAFAEAGATIMLDLPNGDRVEGEVMWVKTRKAGVRFRRSLPARTAVFLGLQDEPKAQIVIMPVPEQQPQGILRHWFRTITRAFD